MSGFVYGLAHNGEIRYVGKSTRSLRARLNRHLREARKAAPGRRHVFDWIKSVDYDVSIVKLEENPFDLGEAERAWIATLRRYGCDLTNVAEGGNGIIVYGREPWNKGKRGVSEETRARMSASARRRATRPVWTEERRQRQSEMMKAAPEWLRAAQEKGRATQQARQLHTPESRRKAGEAIKRRWQSYTPEERKARVDAVRAGQLRAKQRVEGVMPL